MKTPVFTRVCAFLAIGAGVIFAANGAEWEMSSYEAKGRYYIISNTVTETTLTLTDEGVLSLRTAGTGGLTELDLRSAAMPTGLPEIQKVQGFSGLKATLQKAYLPESTKVLGGAAFKECKALTYVKLPEGLEVLGDSAFYRCTALEVVEPCIPGSVTNLQKYVFQECSALTNAVVIGDGVGADGKPRWVDIPYDASNRNFAFQGTKISSLKFGPGAHTVPTFIYNLGGISNLKYVEFGENVTNILENFGGSGVTNFVFRRTKDFTFYNRQLGWSGQNYYMFSSTTKEITFNGWIHYSLGNGNVFGNIGELKLRLIVPGDNVKWAAFMADPAKMTPWASCAEKDKVAYTNRYGEAAQEPVGITVAVTSGMPRSYILTNGATIKENVIEVANGDTDLAPVTLSPAPREDGTYADETDVTVTIAPVEGVTFGGWEGDVAESDKMNTTITVKASGFKALRPKLTSNYFFYRDGTLTDLETTIEAIGPREGLTAAAMMVYTRKDKVLDLSKPIYGGGKIIAIRPYAYKAFGTFTEVRFPETLEIIGNNIFENYGGVKTVTPFLPTSVTNIGEQAFKWNQSLTGSLKIGFATNAAGESVETTVGSSFMTWSTKVGPEVRLGPGIRTIPSSMFRERYGGIGYDYDGPFDLWVGPNVKSAANGAFYGIRYPHCDLMNAGRAVPKSYSVHFEGEMFDGTSGLFMSTSTAKREVNGKSQDVTVWGEVHLPYYIRFYVAAEGTKKWSEFISNTKYVTPWDKLDTTVQDKYWEMFPKGDVYGKKHPYGLTTEASVLTNSDVVSAGPANGLPANQWVFSLKQAGFVLRVQ